MADELRMFTIGHSTRTIAEFVDLLRRGAVEMVVDVRTVPRSRRNPQYNEDVLPAELATYQLGYRRLAKLGGLRGRSSEVPPPTNAFWENRSFHNYADYALSPVFGEGLQELIRLGSSHCCAIMCAEAVWWRCHRRIVADYLMARGWMVAHLMGGDRIEPARLTPGAKIEDDKLVYPAPPSSV